LGVKAPLTSYETIYALPMLTIKEDKGTLYCQLQDGKIVVFYDLDVDGPLRNKQSVESKTRVEKCNCEHQCYADFLIKFVHHIVTMVSSRVGDRLGNSAIARPMDGVSIGTS
jgi:hypothetical protein